MRTAALGLLAILAFSASLSVAAVLPETPMFRALGQVEGLPSERVYALAQDARGYLWVGTGDGLAHFDGVDFQLYQHDPENPASLPANVMQALHVDALDRIWVGSEGGGLSRLDGPGSDFVHYRRGDPAPVVLDDVWTITSDADGMLWFGGFGGGLHRLDPTSGVVEVFRHAPGDPESLSSDHVLALAVDAGGSLWVGTSAGLDRWCGGRFERHLPGPGGPSGAMVMSLLAEPDGRLWIGSSAGLDLRDVDGRIAPVAWRDELGEPGVHGLLRDRGGDLWVGHRAGLDRVIEGRVQAQSGQLRRRLSRSTGAVMALLQDHEGGLWFGTLGVGLVRLDPGWRHFSVLQPDEHDAGSPSAVPQGLALRRAGGLWAVGPGGGLDAIDPVSGRVGRQLTAADDLPDRRLSSVLESADGTLWIGHHRGLSQRAPDGRTLRHWIAGAGADGPPAGPVDLLIDDAAGGVWLSAKGGGIERRDRHGRVLARHLRDDGSGLVAGDTEQLGLGPDGALWLAGAGGLHRRDDDTGMLEPVPGAPSARVHAFAFAADGTLWSQRLGALEQFELIDRRLRLRHRVTAAQGLPAVAAGSLLVDPRGDVWLTTSRGLLQYRAARDSVRRFGIRDGLPSQSFGNRPALLMPDGVLIAADHTGLVMVDPAKLARPSVLPRLQVERIELRRDGRTLALPPSGPLQLRHDDAELHVSVRLLSFADPQAHRYRFRLDGVDPEWVDAGASGERRYPRLAPGRHILRVTAAGADGVWFAPPLALAVEVAAPWWATPAARLAGLVLLLAAGAAMWRWQRRRLLDRHGAEMAERQRQWALRASEAKSRFLATMGHEIRTPMTGVLGMTELLLQTPLDPRQQRYAEAIGRSGRVMLRLVNDALDLARIEAGKLDILSEPFDLSVLLDSVDQVLDPLAAQKGLDYRPRREPGLPRWLRGDALRLQQVLLNLGGNAIKFSERGVVGLAAGPGRDGGLWIEVSDCGPGLSADQQARLFQRFEQAEGAHTAARHGGSGLGLAICRELVAAMGGRIHLHSAPGKGARFRVELPLPHAQPVGEEAPLPARRADVARRFLLVEDDPTVAETVAGLLAAQGYRVKHVPHALAALSELAASPHDGVLLDLDLPGLDGLGLARMLRAQGSQLPLVALTARPDARAEADCLAAGIDGFLRKPASGRALAEAMERAILCRSAQAGPAGMG